MTRLKVIGVAGLLTASIGAVLLAQGVRIEPGALRVVGGAITASAAEGRAIAISRSGSNHAGLTIANGDRNYGVAIDATGAILKIQDDSDGSPRVQVDAANNQVGLVATAGVTNLHYYHSATEQPGFLAYNSANDATLSSGSTVDFDTEVYDLGGDFASDTFTAPVTAQYLLCATVDFQADSGSMTGGFRIVTSNRTYNMGRAVSGGAISNEGLCVIADMDASDTARVEIVFSGPVTATVLGGASPYTTYFSGRLLP